MNRFKFKYDHVLGLKKPQSVWKRGLGVFWAPLWGHNSVNFHPILKIQTVLERRRYYLQFDITIFCFWWISNFGGLWAPNLDPHILVKNEDRGFKQRPAQRSWKVLSDYIKNKNVIVPRKKSEPPLLILFGRVKQEYFPRPTVPTVR